jgi:hypothetical protein
MRTPIAISFWSVLLIAISLILVGSAIAFGHASIVEKTRQILKQSSR